VHGRLPAMLGLALIATGVLGSGCKSPPPPRVPVPSPNNRDTMYERDPVKPLPDSAYRVPEPSARPAEPPPPQQPAPPPPPQPSAAPPPPSAQLPRGPEYREFVEAYDRVGRPRIAVFVNRTFDGEIIPGTNEPPGSASVERLQPGQYDQAAAHSVDYGVIEAMLTDWLANEGRVAVVSPATLRQRLTPEQIRSLESGRPQVLGEVGQLLAADVLVQAQPRATRQSPDGLQVRLVANALNTKGGESIGRAAVDVVPPLDRPQLNRHARYAAIELMDSMIRSWANSTPPPASPASTTTGPAK